MTDHSGLLTRLDYILDPSASATERLNRRAHLTNHDLRTCHEALNGWASVDVEKLVDDAFYEVEHQMDNYLPALGESSHTCRERRLRAEFIYTIERLLGKTD